MADELNLDVDAPDKVAGVLSAAASAYQASAVELSATWQDQRVPIIWAATAGDQHHCEYFKRSGTIQPILAVKITK